MAIGGRRADSHPHEYVKFEENRWFTSREIKGELKRGDMIFVFETADRGTKVTATIDYELPYSVLRKIIDKLMVRKEFERVASLFFFPTLMKPALTLARTSDKLYRLHDRHNIT